MPPECGLAVELGVSRATLALVALEMQGRIAVRHGDGAAVAVAAVEAGDANPFLAGSDIPVPSEAEAGTAGRGLTPTVTRYGLGMMIHAMP